MSEFETKPTIVNDENGIEIIEDDSFSYAGYQVVRGEFFAHIFEPSFTFNSNKVAVNTACVKKLPEVEYVQILVNPETKMLVVRPCSEEEKDSSRRYRVESFIWKNHKAGLSYTHYLPSPMV